MTIVVRHLMGFSQKRRCPLATCELVFPMSTLTWREMCARPQSRKQCAHPLSHRYGRQPRREDISQMNWPEALRLHNQAQPEIPQVNFRPIFIWYDLRLWNHIKWHGYCKLCLLAFCERAGDRHSDSLTPSPPWTKVSFVISTAGTSL